MNTLALALVTGANGFIGSHVVRALLAKHRRVRALVAPGADHRNLKTLDVEIVEGDVRDQGAMQDAVKNCGEIYHLAAYNQLWCPDPSIAMEINVGGTDNLLRAAKSAGVKSLVYTSSAMLYRSEAQRDATEVDFVQSPPTDSAYEQSKYIATRKVLEFEGDQMKVVSVAPTAPIGPGDCYLTAPGRLIVNYMHRKLPAFLDTGINLVDVRQVAMAHVIAAEKAPHRSHFLLGGVNAGLRDFFERLHRLTGIPSPKVRVPYWLAYAASWTQEKVSDLITHRPPTAPLAGVRLARRPCFYDCRKASDQLGLGKTDVEESLKESIAWFKLNGFCA